MARLGEWYADYLDPLTPTPRRDEYSIGATNTPASSLDLTRRTRQLVNALGVADTDALNLVDYRRRLPPWAVTSMAMVRIWRVGRTGL